MAQAPRSEREIYSNFLGHDDPIALTAVDGTRTVGQFRVVGQGMADTDSGIVKQTGPGGIRFTTTTTDQHTIGLETNRIWDVALHGTLVAEARVNLPNNTTKRIFMGFTDIEISSFIPDIEVDLAVGSTTTLTLTASDICGFILDSELTAATAWHSIFNGGATTGQTDSTENVLTPTQTDGEWQVLRVEIDNNGTARWFINGALKQTVAGAASLTTDLKAFFAVGASANTIATMDADYWMVRGNRDETA